jgi:hypothetical protein
MFGQRVACCRFATSPEYKCGYRPIRQSVRLKLICTYVHLCIFYFFKVCKHFETSLPSMFGSSPGSQSDNTSLDDGAIGIPLKHQIPLYMHLDMA